MSSRPTALAERADTAPRRLTEIDSATLERDLPGRRAGDIEQVTGRTARSFAAFVEENQAAWRRSP